jgi:Flp pilus assembly pilin Flp
VIDFENTLSLYQVIRQFKCTLEVNADAMTKPPVRPLNWRKSMLLQFFATWLWCVLPAKSFKKPSSEGQGMVEYAFLLALVALIVIVVLAVVGTAVRDGLYVNIVEAI